MPFNVDDSLYPRRNESADPLQQALRLQSIQSAQEQQALRQVQAQEILAKGAREAVKFQQEQQEQADWAQIWRGAMGPNGLDRTRLLGSVSMHQNPQIANKAPEIYKFLQERDASSAELAKKNLENEKTKIEILARHATGLIAEGEANGGKLEDKSLWKVMSTPEVIAACGGSKQATNAVINCPRNPDGSINFKALLPALRNLQMQGAEATQRLEWTSPQLEKFETPDATYLGNRNRMSGEITPAGKIIKGPAPTNDYEVPGAEKPGFYPPEPAPGKQSSLGGPQVASADDVPVMAQGFDQRAEGIDFKKTPDIDLTLPVTPDTRGKPKSKLEYEARVAEARKTGADAAKNMRELPKAVAAADNFLERIDNALKNPVAKEVVGTNWLNPNKIWPGKPENDFMANLAEIKGKIFREAYDSLKGGGAITEKEEQAMSQALAQLSTTQSYGEFVKALTRVRNLAREHALMGRTSLEHHGVSVRPFTPEERKWFNSPEIAKPPVVVDERKYNKQGARSILDEFGIE